MDAGKVEAHANGLVMNSTGGAYFRTLGKRITQLRIEREMTQAELARMLGVSQQSVFAMELGDRRVRIDLLPVLAKTFDATADELLGLQPLPPPRTGRVSQRLTRHIENIKQMKRTDQRFIIKLAASIARAEVHFRCVNGAVNSQ